MRVIWILKWYLMNFWLCIILHISGRIDFHIQHPQIRFEIHMLKMYLKYCKIAWNSKGSHANLGFFCIHSSSKGWKLWKISKNLKYLPKLYHFTKMYSKIFENRVWVPNPWPKSIQSATHSYIKQSLTQVISDFLVNSKIKLHRWHIKSRKINKSYMKLWQQNFHRQLPSSHIWE
jgi:hypothetical protein